jgi:putative flippase GtrA
MQINEFHGKDQTGSTKLSTMIWLLVLALIVYTIIKIAPVYIRNYQIQNLFEVNANRIQTTPMSDIKADIAGKLVNLNAPITINDVDMNQTSPVSVTISAEYSVAVKFVDDYKITFKFKPKAITDVR